MVAAPVLRSARLRGSLIRLASSFSSPSCAVMDFEGKRLGILRGFAGFASLLLLLFSLSLIWVLTEQTPTQTGDLTRWFANIVDDVRRGSAKESDSEAGEGEPDSSAQTPPCSIVEQPVDSSVRIGELVSFKVVANDAVAYLWGCTDPGTPGWYQIGGVDATKAKYEFEMTKDLAWMEECNIRCLVTFADGSSSYSDEVHIEFRDVMREGKSFRRFAHIIEFGAVGLFASLSALLLLGDRFSLHQLAAGCLVFCMLNSLLDQLHKLFVPGREFDVIDLGLDAIGYALAISLIFGAWRHLHRSSLNRSSVSSGLESKV